MPLAKLDTVWPVVLAPLPDISVQSGDHVVIRHEHCDTRIRVSGRSGKDPGPMQLTLQGETSIFQNEGRILSQSARAPGTKRVCAFLEDRRFSTLAGQGTDGLFM